MIDPIDYACVESYPMRNTVRPYVEQTVDELAVADIRADVRFTVDNVRMLDLPATRRQYEKTNRRAAHAVRRFPRRIYAETLTFVD